MSIRHTLPWLAAILLLSLPPVALAQGLRVSPDTTAVLGGVTVADENVAEDDLAGGVTLSNIGPLPANADVTAYHLLPNGDQLLAFDTTATLVGVTVEPGDVVSFDGTAYSIVFDASAEGVPAGTYVDALSNEGADLVLSFDTTVRLSGATFDDADLVRFLDPGFDVLFDSTAAGVPTGLDLDAAHVLSDATLQLSFDGSGSLGGVAFDDEDVLGFDPGTLAWSLVYDGSAHHASWAPADLDALGEGTDQGGGQCIPAPDPDLNDDGIANILDISIISSCLGQDPTTVAACAIADTNCDGNVDFTDLMFVVGGFGQSF